MDESWMRYSSEFIGGPSVVREYLENRDKMAGGALVDTAKRVAAYTTLPVTATKQAIGDAVKGQKMILTNPHATVTTNISIANYNEHLHNFLYDTNNRYDFSEMKEVKLPYVCNSKKSENYDDINHMKIESMGDNLNIIQIYESDMNEENYNNLVKEINIESGCNEYNGALLANIYPVFIHLYLNKKEFQKYIDIISLYDAILSKLYPNTFTKYKKPDGGMILSYNINELITAINNYKADLETLLKLQYNIIVAIYYSYRIRIIGFSSNIIDAFNNYKKKINEAEKDGKFSYIVMSAYELLGYIIYYYYVPDPVPITRELYDSIIPVYDSETEQYDYNFYTMIHPEYITITKIYNKILHSGNLSANELLYYILYLINVGYYIENNCINTINDIDTCKEYIDNIYDIIAKYSKKLGLNITDIKSEPLFYNNYAKYKLEKDIIKAAKLSVVINLSLLLSNYYTGILNKVRDKDLLPEDTGISKLINIMIDISKKLPIVPTNDNINIPEEGKAIDDTAKVIKDNPYSLIAKISRRNLLERIRKYNKKHNLRLDTINKGMILDLGKKGKEISNTLKLLLRWRMLLPNSPKFTEDEKRELDPEIIGETIVHNPIINTSSLNVYITDAENNSLLYNIIDKNSIILKSNINKYDKSKSILTAKNIKEFVDDKNISDLLQVGTNILVNKGAINADAILDIYDAAFAAFRTQLIPIPKVDKITNATNLIDGINGLINASKNCRIKYNKEYAKTGKILTNDTCQNIYKLACQYLILYAYFNADNNIWTGFNHDIIEKYEQYKVADKSIMDILQVTAYELLGYILYKWYVPEFKELSPDLYNGLLLDSDTKKIKEDITTIDYKYITIDKVLIMIDRYKDDSNNRNIFINLYLVLIRLLYNSRLPGYMDNILPRINNLLTDDDIKNAFNKSKSIENLYKKYRNSAGNTGLESIYSILLNIALIRKIDGIDNSDYLYFDVYDDDKIGSNIRTVVGGYRSSFNNLANPELASNEDMQKMLQKNPANTSNLPQYDPPPPPSQIKPANTNNLPQKEPPPPPSQEGLAVNNNNLRDPPPPPSQEGLAVNNSETSEFLRDMEDANPNILRAAGLSTEEFPNTPPQTESVANVNNLPNSISLQKQTKPQKNNNNLRDKIKKITSAKEDSEDETYEKLSKIEDKYRILDDTTIVENIDPADIKYLQFIIAINDTIVDMNQLIAYILLSTINMRNLINDSSITKEILISGISKLCNKFFEYDKKFNNNSRYYIFNYAYNKLIQRLIAKFNEQFPDDMHELLDKIGITENNIGELPLVYMEFIDIYLAKLTVYVNAVKNNNVAESISELNKLQYIEAVIPIFSGVVNIINSIKENNKDTYIKNYMQLYNKFLSLMHRDDVIQILKTLRNDTITNNPLHDTISKLTTKKYDLYYIAYLFELYNHENPNDTKTIDIIKTRLDGYYTDSKSLIDTIFSTGNYKEKINKIDPEMDESTIELNTITHLPPFQSSNTTYGSIENATIYIANLLLYINNSKYNTIIAEKLYKNLLSISNIPVQFIDIIDRINWDKDDDRVKKLYDIVTSKSVSGNMEIKPITNNANSNSSRAENTGHNTNIKHQEIRGDVETTDADIKEVMDRLNKSAKIPSGLSRWLFSKKAIKTDNERATIAIKEDDISITLEKLYKISEKYAIANDFKSVYNKINKEDIDYIELILAGEPDTLIYILAYMINFAHKYTNTYKLPLDIYKENFAKIYNNYLKYRGLRDSENFDDKYKRGFDSAYNNILSLYFIAFTIDYPDKIEELVNNSNITGDIVKEIPAIKDKFIDIYIHHLLEYTKANISKDPNNLDKSQTGLKSVEYIESLLLDEYIVDSLIKELSNYSYNTTDDGYIQKYILLFNRLVDIIYKKDVRAILELLRYPVINNDPLIDTISRITINKQSPDIYHVAYLFEEYLSQNPDKDNKKIAYFIKQRLGLPDDIIIFSDSSAMDKINYAINDTRDSDGKYKLLYILILLQRISDNKEYISNIAEKLTDIIKGGSIIPDGFTELLSKIDWDGNNEAVKNLLIFARSAGNSTQNEAKLDTILSGENPTEKLTEAGKTNEEFSNVEEAVKAINIAPKEEKSAIAQSRANKLKDWAKKPFSKYYNKSNPDKSPISIFTNISGSLPSIPEETDSNLADELLKPGADEKLESILKNSHRSANGIDLSGIINKLKTAYNSKNKLAIIRAIEDEKDTKELETIKKNWFSRDDAQSTVAISSDTPRYINDDAQSTSTELEEVEVEEIINSPGKVAEIETVLKNNHRSPDFPYMENIVKNIKDAIGKKDSRALVNATKELEEKKSTSGLASAILSTIYRADDTRSTGTVDEEIEAIKDELNDKVKGIFNNVGDTNAIKEEIISMKSKADEEYGYIYDEYIAGLDAIIAELTKTNNKKTLQEAASVADRVKGIDIIKYGLSIIKKGGMDLYDKLVSSTDINDNNRSRVLPEEISDINYKELFDRIANNNNPFALMILHNRSKSDDEREKISKRISEIIKSNPEKYKELSNAWNNFISYFKRKDTPVDIILNRGNINNTEELGSSDSPVDIILNRGDINNTEELGSSDSQYSKESLQPFIAELQGKLNDTAIQMNDMLKPINEIARRLFMPAFKLSNGLLNLVKIIGGKAENKRDMPPILEEIQRLLLKAHEYYKDDNDKIKIYKLYILVIILFTDILLYIFSDDENNKNKYREKINYADLVREYNGMIDGSLADKYKMKLRPIANYLTKCKEVIKEFKIEGIDIEPDAKIIEFSNNPEIPATAVSDESGNNPEIPATAVSDESGNNPKIPAMAVSDKSGNNPEIPATAVSDESGNNPKIPAKKKCPQTEIPKDIIKEYDYVIEYNFDKDQLETDSERDKYNEARGKVYRLNKKIIGIIKSLEKYDDCTSIIDRLKELSNKLEDILHKIYSRIELLNADVRDAMKEKWEITKKKIDYGSEKTDTAISALVGGILMSVLALL